MATRGTPDSSRASLKMHTSSWKEKAKQQCLTQARSRRDDILARLRAGKSSGMGVAQLQDVIANEAREIMRDGSLGGPATPEGDAGMQDVEGLLTESDREELLQNLQRFIEEEFAAAEAALMAQEERFEALQREADGAAADVAEAWEQQCGSQGEAAVLCPICCKYALAESTGLIFCRCGAFRLDCRTEGGTLSHLKSSLASACDEHVQGGCRAPLRFAVELRFGVSALFGYCDACKIFLMIA